MNVIGFLLVVLIVVFAVIFIMKARKDGIKAAWGWAAALVAAAIGALSDFGHRLFGG